MSSVPANLYPGLNDIVDVLEEIPLETSRYLTLLHEIDAKCVHSMPALNSHIGEFLSLNKSAGNACKTDQLMDINRLFKELMPSLEEEMHVSSIMLESLQKLIVRLELAYEIAIRNQEVPAKLRLGVDNHPAMHLHYELMEKIDGKSTNGNNGNGTGNGSKTTQALRSESRREAMVANKKHGNDSASQVAGTELNTSQGDLVSTNDDLQQQHIDSGFATQEQDASRKRTNVNSNGALPESKKRKRRANVKTVPNGSVSMTADPVAVTSASITATAVETPNPVYAHAHQNGTKARTNDYGEPLYCYCNQVAYGEMVGCDGENCELEWFHLPCINLDHLPKGKWYCDDCKKRL
ncbi:hypothetical protein HG535_0A02990 [Zygotorulaspora mrakii]|uniref:Chromatin modification-related protein n=1 Tax=Zygotorulaspora mrakii TaxID=42260 RepID=A0A7H9AVH6_ZYGMR|nr:uncharacterized protein HG535_0A02990 [Zygotorulaspora mrakii]QLG70360.1 hypothetical protein HG535_0A02990 [Zygotorulaspora mrakii]